MSYTSPNVVPGHVDGWLQVRTSFYNELFTDRKELLEALLDCREYLQEMACECDVEPGKGHMHICLLGKVSAAIDRAEGRT